MLSNTFNTNLYKNKTGTRTIKIIHNVIHHSLENALTAGMISRNPAHGVKLPKGTPKEIQIFNEDQVNQMLLAAQGDRYEALISSCCSDRFATIRTSRIAMERPGCELGNLES